MECEAKHVHTIYYHKNLVSLYVVDDFFVEVHFNTKREEIVKSVPHNSQIKLNKFAKTFRLPDDLT